jgi:hypothetical protein
MFCAPVVPRSPIRFAGPRSTASKLDGILAHCLRLSKQKVCGHQYQRSHRIHNFSTSKENVQVTKKCNENTEI